MKKTKRTKRATSLRDVPDFGPPERIRHQEIVIEETPDLGTVRARRINGTPLERYLSRGQITDEQHDAGRRLYRDWYAAGRSPQVTAVYDVRIQSGRRAETSPHQVASWRRFREATRAIGVSLAPVVIDVALWERPARDWAVAHCLPPADGIARLRAGLEELAIYYRARQRLEASRHGRSQSDFSS